MAGARELVLCVSVSQGLRPLQPCSQIRPGLSGKVCIATFGCCLTFAQTRNIEPSGRGNWPMARADVEH